jgi:cytochrome b6-f complex iron-sulfur subunit
MESSRREFCSNACQAVTLIATGTWLSACGGSPTSPGSGSAPPLTGVAANVTGRTISITIDTASVLSAVGAAAIVQTALGVFLVARTAQDTFTALNATCTHEACTITGFSSQRFVCPCHGSEFTTSGAVVQGPAPTALRQFATQFANGVVTFTV